MAKCCSAKYCKSNPFRISTILNHLFQSLWRSLYLRYYEDQTAQRQVWNEYILIKEKEFQLRSYVNKLRQYEVTI